jgi:hypothetical protein
LAWASILAEQRNLNLTPFQVTQAETQKTAADSAVTARLPETYQWLLVPVQAKPQDPVTWEALKLSGTDGLAVRASKKLRTDELYLTSFASTRLRMELDKIPLWRGNHVSIKQLAEDFARYLYLPRLKDSSALLQSISDGLPLFTWKQDTFGYAESFDEQASRYKGIRGGTLVSINDPHSTALVVKAELVSAQLDTERNEQPPAVNGGGDLPPFAPVGDVPVPQAPRTLKPRRFHGTVNLDATRLGRDAGKIAEEVVAHLVGLVGSTVTVTIEVSAEIPDGAPDNVVRTVTENSKTLKFTSHGFEVE